MQKVKSISALLAVTALIACTEPNGEPGRGVMNGGKIRDLGLQINGGRSPDGEIVAAGEARSHGSEAQHLRKILDPELAVGEAAV